MHDAGVDDIAAGIQRYLERNPSAADSVLGIAQWWLPAEGVEAAPESVEAALQQLADHGVVEAVELGGGQRFWRLAAARRQAIEQADRHG